MEDGGEVGLGYIVGKGAIAEDHLCFARRGQLLVPLHDTERQWLHLGGGDLRGEANEESARAESHQRMNGAGAVALARTAWICCCNQSLND